MRVPCNRITLNEAALMNDLKAEAREALEMEGEKLLGHMRREVRHTSHGDAPGKPEWRKEIESNLERTAIAVADDSISMDFGYSPSDKADEVRAMIVEAGSGSAVGGKAIYAGPKGRSVWDNDVRGKHPSKVKKKYKMPAEFNQKGNMFVENAVRRMQTEFGDSIEAVFATTPDSTYYDKVEVTKR